MRYTAVFTALALLASTGAYAQTAKEQSQQRSQPQSQATPQSESAQSAGSNEEQPQLSQSFIRQIQRRLRQAGVYQSTPSGNWDQETADALQQFQQQNGLPSNGEIDGATIVALMRPMRMQQQGGQQQGAEEEGNAGSSSAPSAMIVRVRPMMRAYERGYQEGFQQGFSAATQESQQQ
jgi:murein L,D-transpeptidase YcbB/YkuD